MTPPFGTYFGNGYWQNVSSNGFLPIQNITPQQSSLFSSPYAVMPSLSDSMYVMSGGVMPQSGARFASIPMASSGGSASSSMSSSMMSMLQMMLMMKQLDMIDGGSSSSDRTVGDSLSFDDYDASSGSKLKRAAQQCIRENGSSKGWCGRGVKEAMNKALGEDIPGADAYLWADKLKARSDFKEVKVAADDLASLPAGAVVVWGKTAKSPKGHVSIADGKGNELSDHKAPQLLHLRGYKNCRVFVPT